MKNPIHHILLTLCLLLVLSTAKSSYKVTNTQSTSSTYTLRLSYTGTDEYYIKPTSPIIKELIFTLHVYTYNDFDVKIVDAKNQRFEVPQEGVFPVDPLKNFSYPINLSAIKFEYTENPFDFRITRKANNAVLFSTYDGNFVFSDYYLEISTEVDTDYTYGLG